MNIPQIARQNREESPMEKAYKRISWLALMQIVRDNDRQAVENGHHELFCEILDVEPSWFESFLELFVKRHKAQSKKAGKAKTLEGLEEGKKIRARFFEYLSKRGKTHFVQIAKDFPEYEKRRLNYRLGYMRQLGMVKSEGRVWEAVAPEKEKEKSSRQIVVDYLESKTDWVPRATIMSDIDLNESTLSCSLVQLSQEGRIQKKGLKYKALDKSPRME